MARTILRVACFTTTDAQWRNVLEHYWTRGNEMLAPHGIELAHRNGAGPPIPQEINYAGDVIRKAGDTGDVRHQCHLAWPNGRGIPVICCNFLAGALDTGNTVTPDDPDAADANRGVHWLPYILINARNYSVTGSTIVHEMLHATGLTNDDHEKNDTTSAFHWNANSASFKTVSNAYAERLRTRAYFAEAK